MPPAFEPLRPLLPYCVAWGLFMLVASVLLGPVRRGLNAPMRRGARVLLSALLILAFTTCAVMLFGSAIWTLGEFGLTDGLSPDGWELRQLSVPLFGRTYEVPLVVPILFLTLLVLLIALFLRRLFSRIRRPSFTGRS